MHTKANRFRLYICIQFDCVQNGTYGSTSSAVRHLKWAYHGWWWAWQGLKYRDEYCKCYIYLQWIYFRLSDQNIYLPSYTPHINKYGTLCGCVNNMHRYAKYANTFYPYICIDKCLIWGFGQNEFVWPVKINLLLTF